MQNIADWLQSLGMSDYVQSFADNDIDFSILSDLTDQDLEKLGVVSLGHRRKILRAIATLQAGEMSAPISSNSSPVPAFDSAERRQVTVMFSDLVGSTALSARMDPEDLREVISIYQNTVAETVRRSGGFVAKYMGDGVLIYFGYPRAHEDDAEQAVLAGLELIAAVAKLKTRAPLQTRVGIATGIVVVGDLIGSGEAQERGIVGETPNLAARLQGVAKPNMVVIAEGTRRLVGNLFELVPLDLMDLKGLAGPVRSWAALRRASIESRFEALRTSGLTTLVGREEEINVLLGCWARIKTGEGQVVHVSGDAGIGKSRLTAALLERVAGEPHTRMRYFCSPQHTNSAFHPIIGQLERAARISYDDTAESRLDKLDAMLAQSSTSATDAALLADLLSLPNDGRYPTLDLGPEQRRHKTLDALIFQMEAAARQHPVLIIFEDAHWADPTTQEIFGRVVDRIRTLRGLLLITFRPEFKAQWAGRPHVTTLTLDRLPERDVDAMIDRVRGNDPIPAAIRRDIIERADGIPLFVEEMTKAILEAGSDGEARQTAATVPPPALAVPASLHASLMARLDRLGAAKEVAQVGAVIGREFSHVLLAAAAGKPEAELGWALDRLIDAGLLFRRGFGANATYLFKHALVQDAAYGTLLREPRRALHARIVHVLQTTFSEIADSQPELLARHCTEAGLIDQAARLWSKAGQQSLARSALVEAVGHFTRALDQFATLPITAARQRDLIEAQIGLANTLVDVKGHAAPETKSAFRRARELMKQADDLDETLGDPVLRFSVLFGLWRAAYVAFDGGLMRELAAECLVLADKHETTVLLSLAHRLLGMTLELTGELAEARAQHDQALALFDPAAHRPLAPRFGPDLRVSALAFRALTLWLLGYPEAAQADINDSVREAREIGQATSLMLALGISNYTHIVCGNGAAANALAEELVALANEKGAALRKAEGVFQQGCVLALTGKDAEAVRVITRGITAWRATGATCWTPLHMSFLASVYARLGQFDDARRCIGEALAASKATGESWCDAEIHRLAGDIVVLSGEPDMAKAEAHFKSALAVARGQQARSFELRAASALARLWRDQGKRGEARDLVAGVYSRFTEGFDTTDLQHAKKLLKELVA